MFLMVTVSLWYEDRAWGLGDSGDEISFTGEDEERLLTNLFNLFLKTAVKMAAGGLFQYFTTLAEKAP